MQTAKRRRTGWAIAASVMVHLAAGLALLLQRQPEVASEPAISVLLVVRPPVSAANAPRPKALRVSRRAAETPPPQTPSVPIAPPATPGASAPGPAVALAGPSGPDLRPALRHGVAGCANLAGRMSRAEREHCDDQLALGAAQAKPVGLALEPRIRAYYDAVALAKKPDGPLTRIGIKGDGPFAVDQRGVTGHGPAVGCKIKFGAGKAPRLPSHWLKLGPCFIAPPQGPLSVEADITPPDQDMNPR